MFSREQIDKMKVLLNSIPDEVERIIEHNSNLQEITKEYLGEEISENVMKKIVKQEIEKGILEKMVGVLFGE